MGGTSFHICNQVLSSLLADTEKTYSGLTDACAAAGRAGCKLIEFTGDNASGDDVKALLNNAHDVIYIPPKPGDPADSILILGGPPALSRWSTSPYCPRLYDS
jgi:hypothetical protein